MKTKLKLYHAEKTVSAKHAGTDHEPILDWRRFRRRDHKCIKVYNSHPNKHVNQDEGRIWGEKLGESLANGQPARMKNVANSAPDETKEVFLTKVEVNYGSLL